MGWLIVAMMGAGLVLEAGAILLVYAGLRQHQRQLEDHGHRIKLLLRAYLHVEGAPDEEDQVG